MKRIWVLGIIIVIIIAAVALVLTYQPQAELNTVTFSLNGVEDVSPAHLEGWAIFGEEKVSTGKFDVGHSLTFTTEPFASVGLNKIALNPEAIMLSKCSVSFEGYFVNQKLPLHNQVLLRFVWLFHRVQQTRDCLVLK